VWHSLASRNLPSVASLLSTFALDLQTTATLIKALSMASPVPNNNSSSSPQDSASTSNSQSKPKEDIVAWAIAHMNDPPHREKIERTPGDGRKNHGGPIRIISKDGVLTEHGGKIEQEQLVKSSTTNDTGGEKEIQSSS
jgi:hypothetical protein